jgi:hypothetical protein
MTCLQDSIQIYPITNSQGKLNVRGKTGAHVQIYLWTFDRGWLQKSIIETPIIGICDLLSRHSYFEYVTYKSMETLLLLYVFLLQTYIIQTRIFEICDVEIYGNSVVMRS